MNDFKTLNQFFYHIYWDSVQGHQLRKLQIDVEYCIQLIFVFAMISILICFIKNGAIFLLILFLSTLALILTVFLASIFFWILYAIMYFITWILTYHIIYVIYCLFISIVIAIFCCIINNVSHHTTLPVKNKND